MHFKVVYTAAVCDHMLFVQTARHGYMRRHDDNDDDDDGLNDYDDNEWVYVMSLVFGAVHRFNVRPRTRPKRAVLAHWRAVGTCMERTAVQTLKIFPLHDRSCVYVCLR